MRTCIKLDTLAFPVSLEQHSRGRFRVTYGRQVDDGLSYAEAATKLGAAIMHALACEGNLDASLTPSATSRGGS